MNSRGKRKKVYRSDKCKGFGRARIKKSDKTSRGIDLLTKDTFAKEARIKTTLLRPSQSWPLSEKGGGSSETAKVTRTTHGLRTILR